MSKRHYSWKRFYRKKKSYPVNIKTAITENSDLKIDDYQPSLMIAEKGPIKIDK